jgi:hypothetical protein
MDDKDFWREVAADMENEKLYVYMKLWKRVI